METNQKRILELFTLFNIPFDVNKTIFDQVFRRLSKILHPDRGGDTGQMQLLIELRTLFVASGNFEFRKTVSSIKKALRDRIVNNGEIVKYLKEIHEKYYFLLTKEQQDKLNKLVLGKILDKLVKNQFPSERFKSAETALVKKSYRPDEFIIIKSQDIEEVLREIKNEDKYAEVSINDAITEFYKSKNTQTQYLIVKEHSDAWIDKHRKLLYNHTSLSEKTLRTCYYFKVKSLFSDIEEDLKFQYSSLLRDQAHVLNLLISTAELKELVDSILDEEKQRNFKAKTFIEPTTNAKAKKEGHYKKSSILQFIVDNFDSDDQKFYASNLKLHIYDIDIFEYFQYTYKKNNNITKVSASKLKDLINSFKSDVLRERFIDQTIVIPRKIEKDLKIKARKSTLRDFVDVIFEGEIERLFQSKISLNLYNLSVPELSKQVKDKAIIESLEIRNASEETHLRTIFHAKIKSALKKESTLPITKGTQASEEDKIADLMDSYDLKLLIKEFNYINQLILTGGFQFIPECVNDTEESKISQAILTYFNVSKINRDKLRSREAGGKRAYGADDLNWKLISTEF